MVTLWAGPCTAEGASRKQPGPCVGTVGPVGGVASRRRLRGGGRRRTVRCGPRACWARAILKSGRRSCRKVGHGASDARAQAESGKRSSGRAPGALDGAVGRVRAQAGQAPRPGPTYPAVERRPCVRPAPISSGIRPQPHARRRSSALDPTPGSARPAPWPRFIKELGVTSRHPFPSRQFSPSRSCNPARPRPCHPYPPTVPLPVAPRRAPATFLFARAPLWPFHSRRLPAPPARLPL